MARILSRVLVLPLVTVTLLAGTATLTPGASRPPQSFSEGEIFFELNDTDGDLGIHASIDGGPWTDLKVERLGAQQLLSIRSLGGLRTQSLTALTFESAEPSFDQLPPADFLRRFPEGRYEIEGNAQGGGTIRSTARLSHVFAAPPENVTLSGMPAAKSCEDRPLPKVSPPVTIRWDPVTRSHPEIGKKGPITVSRYQLFVERSLQSGGITLTLDLPPTVTEFEVPTSVTNGASEFKFEIIVRTSTGNNTAVESCFQLR